MSRFSWLPVPLLRQFVYLFIPLASTVGLVFGLVYYGERKVLVQLLEVSQQEDLEQQQQFILQDFETAISDLQLLAQQEELQEALEGGEAEAADFADELLAVLRSKRLYDQVRVLDRAGQEIVRVNYHQGRPQLVPPEQLQDKSGRTYFSRATTLNGGDVYLSPFNLNLENSVIERPFKPVIRLSTPILDDEGNFQGVLVLNYLGDRLLQLLNQTNEQELYHTQLVNGHGYWLEHNEVEKEWGEVLPERAQQSLPQDEPELWQGITRQLQGHWATPTQLYTFRKVPLLQLIQDYNQQGEIVVSRDTAQSYDWRLLNVMPKTVIQQKMRPLRHRLKLMYLGVMLLLTPGLGTLLMSRHRNREAEAQLLRSQQSLLAQKEQAELLSQRLSSQIRDSFEPEEVITTAVNEVFHLLKGDRCTFAWIDPQTKAWTVIYEAKQDNLSTLIGQHISITPLVEKFETCRLLSIDDAAQLTDPDLKAVLKQRGHCAVLASRLTTHDEAVGVLLCGISHPHQWTSLEIELLEDVSAQVAIALNQAELLATAQQNAAEAQAAFQQLQQTQSQLIRSEKMSSLGQLVAGVAHEINNPVNFIYGNITHAAGYTTDLLDLLEQYQSYVDPPPPELAELLEDLDWEFLQEDLPKILNSMQVGAERIREIVKSLRTFSRLDEAEQKQVDIHSGIDSTLMILNSRLKGKTTGQRIEVIQNYGDLPPIDCYPGLLNQVLMNLIANAIDALEDAMQRPDWPNTRHPRITITTIWFGEQQDLEIRIQDNGTGMEQSTQAKLFDPFFTTKPVGKGTGLGLSISYQIIVETHKGTLDCISQLGQGTTFVIRLPQSPLKAATAPHYHR